MNLKFDYVLTIRYDDSHSDCSMLCSSEMNEWCVFVSGFDRVLFIRRDDGLSDSQLTSFHSNSAVVQKCHVFDFSHRVKFQCTYVFLTNELVLFLLLLCKFLVMVPNC